MATSYELLASCTIGGVPVNKYRSLKTKIVVSIAQVEGPLVNGFFCLATEAHDDDGLPHTLEHLIFMGSEQYPYKGVLDLLANRCLAQGTNAWTDVDHTCYTVTTAGSEGFLNLLPIYLDHILYPTLTDSAFTTEVHHINGEGEDAGVVYCEMQARENTSEDLTHYEMLQLMYPGKCGYKSETGGRMLNLRTSTTNEKVQSYHRSYYRPDNLSLLITGQVEVGKVFKAIESFEEKITNKEALPWFERPWQSSVDPLLSSQIKEVPFPTSEEDDGVLRICWRGPNARDRYAMTAMEILMEYLSDTPVSPLQRDLVEVSDAYCSDVEVMELENSVSVFGVTLEGVPTEKLADTEPKVWEILDQFSKGSEEFDLTRMANILKQKILKIMDQVEESPHYFFAFSLIGDFLFGDTPEDFSAYLDQIPRYKQLLEQPAAFWKNLLDKYLVNSPKIIILGKPSSQLADKIAEDEKNRIEAQRQMLGNDGLQQKKETLDLSIKQNEIPAPDDIIASLPVPGTDSISFHPIAVLKQTPDTEPSNEYKKFPVEKLPLNLQVNHIHTSFVEVKAVLEVETLPVELKPYLSVYSELLFESPISRNGEIVPYETVVTELEADTVQHRASIGIRGSSRFTPGEFPEALFVCIKVESSKYEKGVQWLYDVIHSIHFSDKRLSVVSNKMINDVNRMKRDGSAVTSLLIRYIRYTEESNKNISSMVSQLKFLTQLQERLKDPSTRDSVLADMEKVKAHLTDPKRLRLFVDTDVNSLPEGSWKVLEIFPSKPLNQQSPQLSFSTHFVSPNSTGRTLVAGVGGVESNYMIQCLPVNLTYSHPDLPPIMVYMECLGALEGPMWRQIRGMGLSYHYYLDCRPENGSITFLMYQSTQLVQAYTVARDIVTNYVSGSTKFDDVQIESAKSSVLYDIIRRESTVAKAATQALLSNFYDVPIGHNKSLLDNVLGVTVEDLERVGQTYFRHLFDPLKISCAVCCNPSKVSEVKEGLERFGHCVEVVADIDELAVKLT